MAMAPAFAPPKQIQRVLVLGVGGGAALRLIAQHFRPKLVAGVELDALRVQLAKKYFGLKGKRFKLYCDNAVNWMERYDGEGFDLIIDDIFGEVDGEPQRFIPVTSSWANLLCRALNPDGLLVVNTLSASELESTALVQTEKYQKRFRHAYQFQHPQSENGIGVFSPFETTPYQFRKRIKELEGMETATVRKKLNFSIKTLW
jgi:spermidine synthase